METSDVLLVALIVLVPAALMWAVFIARTGSATPTPCSEPPFTDVPVDHPFCPEIAWMKESGVSTGFDDGTYRPAANVTRQAMSAFIYRLSLLLP